MKQMGVGLAVAVLLDATVVRMVLLPAVMMLLGERNWYLPRWLGRLPRMEHGEAAGTVDAAAPAAHAGVPQGSWGAGPYGEPRPVAESPERVR
jgi:RND superfamily putative drug exporter